MREILNKQKIVLAVDPGKSGAVARVGRGLIEARRDFKELSDITQAVRETGGDNLVAECVIEMVGARPGQGVCSMFSFGKATGVAFGALYSLQKDRRMFAWVPPITEVHPIKWQSWCRRELKMGKKEPFDSRQICLTLFPDSVSLFRRKKDHNTADAVLMGLWKLAQL